MQAEVKKFPLVLLAAGESVRMGIPKGLVSVEGKPWLLHQLDAARKVGIERVIVVLGYHADAYLKAIPDLKFVLNSDPSRGQFSSLQRGLQEVGSSGAFLLPVDTPCPALDVWERCARALSPQVEACVPVFEGKGGHPTLLGPTFVAHLLALTPASSRLDHEIHRLPPEKVARPDCADAKIKMNLNTPQDWAATKGVKC